MNREEILKEIEEIRVDCSVKDWDGYDGYPISPKAIDYILEFISKLSDEELRLAEPSPFPNERMGIEWDLMDGKVFSFQFVLADHVQKRDILVVSIDKKGNLYYTAIIENKTIAAEYNFAKEGIKQELMDLIKLF